MSEISTKPYLLRAIHEWCTDSGLTPYIAVSVDENTVVPDEFVRAGEIVLNVSLTATNRLAIGNEVIEFQARFGGVGRELSIPVDNVSAIYARENGHGMAFEVTKQPAVAQAADDLPESSEPLAEDAGDIPVAAKEPTKKSVPRKKTRPSLASVPKSEPDSASNRESVAGATEEAPTPDGEGDGADQRPAKSKSRGKPNLTRVK